jgi:hypothetical protein
MLDVENYANYYSAIYKALETYGSLCWAGVSLYTLVYLEYTRYIFLMFFTVCLESRLTHVKVVFSRCFCQSKTAMLLVLLNVFTHWMGNAIFYKNNNPRSFLTLSIKPNANLTTIRLFPRQNMNEENNLEWEKNSKKNLSHAFSKSFTLIKLKAIYFLTCLGHF